MQKRVVEAQVRGRKAGDGAVEFREEFVAIHLKRLGGVKATVAGEVHGTRADAQDDLVVVFALDAAALQADQRVERGRHFVQRQAFAGF